MSKHRSAQVCKVSVNNRSMDGLLSMYIMVTTLHSHIVAAHQAVGAVLFFGFVHYLAIHYYLYYY